MSSSLESQNDQFVRTSIVKRGEAIEGPRPAEIEPAPAFDESVWKFIVPTPTTETPAGERAAAIDGPKPVEIEPPAMDESIWKFIVDTPPTETTEAQPSVPESSEASGWKSSHRTVARPALPEVHPAEKLVDDSSVETTIGVQETGAGALVDAVLVQSNVDIARQFTQLILALRAYQANSESTVSNELLADTLNIKR